jgi:hypothetical protein
VIIPQCRDNHCHGELVNDDSVLNMASWPQLTGGFVPREVGAYTATYHIAVTAR